MIHILARHAQDPEETIVRAVNDTKDNDTIAAIVGAAVGALHGRSKLPARWIDGLLGRTGIDDGRIFQLIAAAGRGWVNFSALFHDEVGQFLGVANYSCTGG